MRKVKNTKALIIVIVVIAAATYFSLRSCSKDSGLVYRYEKADIGEVNKTIATTGTLEIIDPHLIISKISGLVTRVYVDFNDNVRKGQLLAEIDTTEIDQEIAKIALKKDEAALTQASAYRDLKDKQEMLKDNLIARRGVEAAEIEYKRSETRARQIQSEYESARNKRNFARITAPSSGIIISKDIQQDAPVNENKVLFTIAEDLKKMRLVIQVDESDSGMIKNDQKVSFSVSAFPDKNFEGRITQVRLDPVRKDQLVSYKAIVTCDNKDLLLKPGMTATATVEVFNKKNVLRVPGEAFIVSPTEIQTDRLKKYVWVKDSVAMNSLPVKRIEVKTGLSGDYFTEIISGKIKAGDDILIAINKKGDQKESIR
jgi:HlyD family secretion protein